LGFFASGAAAASTGRFAAGTASCLGAAAGASFTGAGAAGGGMAPGRAGRCESGTSSSLSSELDMGKGS